MSFSASIQNAFSINRDYLLSQCFSEWRCNTQKIMRYLDHFWSDPKSSRRKMAICKHCESDPCLWVQHKECVLAAVEVFKEQRAFRGESTPNNVCRKYCYRQFSLMIHGPLWKGHRLKLPCCVEENVRLVFPNKEGIEYTGFKKIENNGIMQLRSNSLSKIETP